MNAKQKPNAGDGLLFIDTNKWLDFYRTKNETGRSLLARLDGLADRLIITFQVEQEFKKNRQNVIVETFKELSVPRVSSPALFKERKIESKLDGHMESAQRCIDKMKESLERVLADPIRNDPVYQTLQRLVRSDSPLNLKRNSPEKADIRRRALRRFLYGCPPRKKNDTSMGDGVNWEWIVRVAQANRKLPIHIITRDTDYGITFGKHSFLNDHLAQEFKDRVSQKGKIFLHSHLTEALEAIKIDVTKEEVAAEAEIVAAPVVEIEPAPVEAPPTVVTIKGVDWQMPPEFYKTFREVFAKTFSSALKGKVEGDLFADMPDSTSG